MPTDSLTQYRPKGCAPEHYRLLNGDVVTGRVVDSDPDTLTIEHPMMGLVRVRKDQLEDPAQATPKPNQPAKPRFTDELKRIVLEDYAKYGVMSEAALKAGISTQTVQQHQRRDPEFRDACERAQAIYRTNLTKEIHRRGVEGWDEPVFYKGQIVGTIRRFDSNLLVLQARRFEKEYVERQAVDMNVKAGVLVIPAPAGGQPPADRSQEEMEQDWMQQYGRKRVDNVAG